MLRIYFASNEIKISAYIISVKTKTIAIIIKNIAAGFLLTGSLPNAQINKRIIPTGGIKNVKIKPSIKRVELSLT